MGNEMGNQNASGIKGEENEAIDAKEKVDGIAPEDDIKGENHIVPEGESKDYHEKAGEFSTHDLPASIDSDLKLPASDEREENEKEPNLSAQFPEVVQKEGELIRGNGHDIQRAILRHGDHHEESSPEANAEDKISKDDVDDDDDVEVLDNKASANEVSPELKSEAHESTDIPPEAAEGDHNLLSRESKETEEINVSGNSKENGHLIHKENGEDHGASAVSSDDDHYAEEKNVDLQDEFTVENGLKIEPKAEVQPEIESSDYSSESNLQNAAQTSDEIGLIAEKLENGENKNDLTRDEDLANSNPGTDSCQMDNEEKSSVSIRKTEEVTEMTPEAGIPKEMSMTMANNEEDEKKRGEYTMKNAKEEKYESYTTGNGNGSDEKDTIDKQISPLELSNQGKCLDIANPDASAEDANDTIGRAPFSNVVTQNQEAERELQQKIHSASETLAVTPPKPDTRPLNAVMQNQEAERELEQNIHSALETLAVTPSNPNPKPFNVVMQNQEADRELEQNIHSEETPERRLQSPNPKPMNVVKQNQEAERESEQKIHSKETLAVTPPNPNPKLVSKTSFAEAEHPSEQLNEQYANGETAPFSGVVPESVGRHSVESNPCEKIELRKCSSFDFGIPADARSEESDQTPLLRHETTVSRSFSSCSNATFHSANGRSSLDYEPVVVEEKTIRMERSDSSHSRGVSNAAIFTLQKQENHVGSKKVENGSRSSPAKEVEFTSPGSSGKRKPKSSLFTTCLCCTAAIS